MLFNIPFISGNFIFNSALLIVNIFSLAISLFGNIKVIWRFGKQEPLFNNLISLLSLLDAVAAVVGNGKISYYIIQGICNSPKVCEFILHFLSMVGVTNIMVLTAITVNCWYSVRRTWLPYYGGAFTKFVVFTCIAFLLQMHIRVHWQQQIKGDQLVTIASLSFCALNVILYQTVSTLHYAVKFHGKTTHTMLQHQCMFSELVIRSIHFAFAWVPILVFIKATCIFESHHCKHSKPEYLLWCATLALSKGAFGPILALMLNSRSLPRSMPQRS